jgi:hypothetical protein
VCRGNACVAVAPARPPLSQRRMPEPSQPLHASATRDSGSFPTQGPPNPGAELFMNGSKNDCAWSHSRVACDTPHPARRPDGASLGGAARAAPAHRPPAAPAPPPAVFRVNFRLNYFWKFTSGSLLLEVYFWKFMMRPNESAASDAPPTRQPSMSGRRISSSTVSPVTEPLRTHEAAAPQVSTGTRSSKETSMSGVETRRSPVEDARLVRGRLVVHLGDVRADELVHL